MGILFREIQIKIYGATDFVPLRAVFWALILLLCVIIWPTGVYARGPDGYFKIQIEAEGVRDEFLSSAAANITGNIRASVDSDITITVNRARKLGGSCNENLNHWNLFLDPSEALIEPSVAKMRLVATGEIGKATSFKFEEEGVYYFKGYEPNASRYCRHLITLKFFAKQWQPQVPAERDISVRLADENLEVYEIVTLKFPELETPKPVVKLKIEGVDVMEPEQSSDFEVIFNVEAKLSNNLGTFHVPAHQVRIYPLAVPSYQRRVEGKRLLLEIGLYEVLSSWLEKPEPYLFLARKHLNPTRGEELEAKITGVPGETKFELTIKPVEIRLTPRTSTGIPKEEVFDLSGSEKSTATFRFGLVIDLEKETKLKIGDDNPIYWHDVPDVLLAVLKFATGVEGVLDVLDAGLQVQGGEYLDAVVTLVAPAPIELLFMIPELNRGASYFTAPAKVVRETEKALLHQGYFPPSKVSYTKNWSIWVNLLEEKLALIDPNGIVHRVKPPKNFHVSWPYFTFWDAEPHGFAVSYAVADRQGKFRNWKTIQRVDNHSLIPPPRSFHPVRVTLSVPVRPVGIGPHGGTPSASQLEIKTHSGGKLILTDEGKQLEPNFRPGVLDMGWEDDPAGLVLKKPYVCLVSGKLYVKDEKSKIGVGFYRLEQGDRIRLVPKVWVKPKGTEYTIEVLPKGEEFQISTIEGSVEVRDRSGKLIDTVKAGIRKDIKFPGVSLEGRIPTPPEDVKEPPASPPRADIPPYDVKPSEPPTIPKPLEGQLPIKPLPKREVVQQYDNGTINWSKGTITAVGIGAPPPNAVNMAQARAMARRAAIVVARRNLLELVQGVQIDSLTLVKEAVVQSDIIRTSIQGVVRNAKIVDTDYMSDGSVEVKVAMNMSGQLANTVLPQHSLAVPWATGPSVATVTPETLKPSSDIITGLVVDARGLGARPAMSPKIVDETGKEIYGSAMVNRQHAVQQGMAGYSRDLSAAQSASRVTANPLTVKGLRSVGPGKSDIVISNSDASRILSAAENLLFMQKCRVMIVVD